MSESPKHKFQAILFADIVGYTALMQKQEQVALGKLQYFKQQLETITPTHKGNIIQFYGDGCLIAFDDSIAALSCARDLQFAFSKNELSVRIGLHEGEVVYKDNNVFGHVVNIASRVESLGIAGAILITQEVKQAVEGVVTFQLAFVGNFKLKNVEEKLAIYAFANPGFPVPSKTELNRNVNNSATNSKSKNGLLGIMAALLVAIVGFFTWQQFPSAKIDTQILKERIAVLPFENNTNDPNLEVFGSMAADWINTGLMETEAAEVVSPFTVRTHQAAIGILANDPQNRPSFAQLTGAKNLISGAYYKSKQELIFKLELVDAQNGQLRFSFKEIREDIANKEALLAKLRKQVTGYWVAKELVDAKKISPPNFEAYKLYLANLQKKGTAKDLQKILDLDSTFYLPRIHFLNVVVGSMRGAIKPHFDFLDRHIDQLSEYEKALFTYLKGLYIGQPVNAFESLNSIRQKYPKDFLLNHACADIALSGLNNPELALTIYHELSLDEGQAQIAGVYWNERLLNMVSCYVELNELEQVSKLLSVANPNPEIDNNYYIKTRLIEALASNNPEKINRAYEELKGTLQTKPFQYFWTNIELIQSNLLTAEFRQEQERDFLKSFKTLPPKSMNRLFMNNFHTLVAKKGKVDIVNLDNMPKGMRIGNLAAIGQFYIESGQTAKIPAIIDQLSALTTCDYTSQIKTTCAAAYYYIGQLYAETGQPEKAMEHLKKANELGLGNELHRFQYARYLSALFDLPAFQAIIQPIWPSKNSGKIYVKKVSQYQDSPDNLEDITASFQEERQIKLNHHNQFAQINLGMTANYQKQKVNYLYQLENLDRDWLVADKEVITISNLPYGQQKLKVKAQFADGRFGEEIVEIPIVRTKPFYLNIWFVFTLLLVVFGSVFMLPNFVKTDSKLGY